MVVSFENLVNTVMVVTMVVSFENLVNTVMVVTMVVSFENLEHGDGGDDGC